MELYAAALGTLSTLIGGLVLFVLSGLRSDIREIRTEGKQTEEKRAQDHAQNQLQIAVITERLDHAGI